MKITIIGWYGTETIGDRAILAGIFSALHAAYGSFEVQLGSLYPFFSERTLSEDAALYAEMCGGAAVSVRLFNSRESKSLDAALAWCDVLLMGGGPLMHIHTLFMVEYAFKKARKNGKKTAVLGCGIGPLEKKMHRQAVYQIFKHSDEVVLRDALSADFFRTFADTSSLPPLQVAIDPAVACLLAYRHRHTAHTPAATPPSFAAISLRAFPNEYARVQAAAVQQRLEQLLQQMSIYFPDYILRLVPMHYFHIGNDDRDFLNELRFRLQLPQVQVQNEILSLEQTMQTFMQANLNVGMRFHAVVFQTLLKGNNYIVDYTDPQKGKISGFLQEIGAGAFYQSRYINLQSTEDAAKELDFSTAQQQVHRADEVLLRQKVALLSAALQKL